MSVARKPFELFQSTMMTKQAEVVIQAVRKVDDPTAVVSVMLARIANIGMLSGLGDIEVRLAEFADSLSAIDEDAQGVRSVVEMLHHSYKDTEDQVLAKDQ
jgi:hypothetical protein